MTTSVKAQVASATASVPITWALGLIVAVMLGGFTVLWNHIDSTEHSLTQRIDRLDQRMERVEQMLVGIETILDERLPKPTAD